MVSYSIKHPNYLKDASAAPSAWQNALASTKVSYWKKKGTKTF